MDVQLQSLGPPTVTLPIVTTPTMVEYSAVDLSKLYHITRGERYHYSMIFSYGPLMANTNKFNFRALLGNGHDLLPSLK